MECTLNGPLSHGMDLLCMYVGEKKRGFFYDGLSFFFKKKKKEKR